MIRKLLALAAAAFILGGCVLQSRVPIYTDKDADLALGKVGGTTETASLRDGQWVIDKERHIIAVEGRHYVVRSSTNVALHFTQVSGDWYVIQGREDNGPAAYLLAEVKDRVAMVRPIACSDLKSNTEAANFVEHQGDDCFIKPGAAAKKLFTSLLKNPGEPVFRMQIIH
jgi:hypothetical protein